jgi:hypothetical protein
LDICHAAMPPRRLAVIAFRRFAAYRIPPAFGGYQRLGYEWESHTTEVGREGGPKREGEGRKGNTKIEGRREG